MNLFKPVITALIVIVLAFLCGCIEKRQADDKTLLVFAAASLRDVMQEVAEEYKKQTGVVLVFNFSGSNVLAKQIEASRKADVYLSANAYWMDYLSLRNMIHKNSERVFLSNHLVVVAQKDTHWRMDTISELDELPFRFLSLGDPDAVPAGRYAKQYLKTIQVNNDPNEMSVWDSVKDKVLPAPDVRAAAGMVKDMHDIIGIVYKTDAIVSKLKILHEIHYEDNTGLEQVRYLAAAVNKTVVGDQRSANKEKADQVANFLAFLLDRKTQSIFEGHGFTGVSSDNL